MKYKVLLEENIHKKLKNIPVSQRDMIIKTIYGLGENPDHQSLPIKKLTGNHPYYRLQLKDWRFIFRRNDVDNVINIDHMEKL